MLVAEVLPAPGCPVTTSPPIQTLNPSPSLGPCKVLRLGGADVAIGYLELLQNNIGPRGATGLGQVCTLSGTRALPSQPTYDHNTIRDTLVVPTIVTKHDYIHA